MTKVSIRRFLRPTTALQLALVLFALASSSKWASVEAQEEGEHVEQQQEYQEPPPEDPVPPQQEEAPPVEQEEAPPVQEEAPPVQEEAPPVQEEAPPVQEEVEVPPEPPIEESPPPIEESPPPREESPPPIDDSLFELNVFECVAPHGDPAPKRQGPVMGNSIMTLCIRPQNEKESVLKSINLLEFSATRGPSQAAVRDNAAAGPMTRAICPMQDDQGLCIAATKLNDEFFAKSYAKVSGAGEVVVAAAGEERTVSFDYKFSTAKTEAPPPIDHVFFDFPTNPPSFPCGNEIRIWMVVALLLTLLEFAFSSDSEDKKESESGGGTKKKKTKSN